MERERYEDKSQDRTECSQSVLYEECPHHTSVYCMRSVPTTPVCTVRGVSPPHTITPTHFTNHYHSLHPSPPLTPPTTLTHSPRHPHSPTIFSLLTQFTLVWGHPPTTISADLFHTADRLLTHYQM